MSKRYDEMATHDESELPIRKRAKLNRKLTTESESDPDDPPIDVESDSEIDLDDPPEDDKELQEKLEVLKQPLLQSVMYLI